MSTVATGRTRCWALPGVLPWWLARLLIALTAAVFVITAVWALQIHSRLQVLVWDEAVRVQAGVDFAACLAHGDMGCSWRWLHRQTFYPFLLPMLHGALIASNFEPLAASWLPSLTAFCIGGLLLARLAGALGMSATVACLAVVLYWSCPFAVRLAAWGSLEHLGACEFLIFLLALVKLERSPSATMAVLTGVIASVAWFLKWDYGIVAWASLLLAAAVAAARDRRRDWFTACLLSLFVSMLLVGAWMSVNLDAKVSGAVQFTSQGISYRSPEQDPFFYIKGLFKPELGLSPLVAALFLGGSVVGGIASMRRELASGPILLLLAAVPVYSVSEVKNLRYLAPFIPVLALLAAAAFAQLVSLARRSSRKEFVRSVGPAMLCVLLLCQLAVQVVGPNGVRHRFPFLEPNSAVVQAVRFAANTMRDEPGPAWVVGWSNQLSPATLQIAWSQARGTPAPDVWPIPAAPDEVAPAMLFARAGIPNLIAIDADRGSALYDSEARAMQSNLDEALAVLQALEDHGSIDRLDSFEPDDLTTITIYRRVSPPAGKTSVAQSDL